MRTGRIQTYPYVFLAALFVVFAGCFLSANAVQTRSADDMVSADDVRFADGMAGHISRNTNRLCFNSLLAVLFKIAVIPSMIIIMVILTEHRGTLALGRILRFVHDSDGKKES